jgi:hypothetical protein
LCEGSVNLTRLAKAVLLAGACSGFVSSIPSVSSISFGFCLRFVDQRFYAVDLGVPWWWQSILGEMFDVLDSEKWPSSEMVVVDGLDPCLCSQAEETCMNVLECCGFQWS